MSAVLKDGKRMPRMVIEQYVEVDIADFDDDALLLEIERRQLQAPNSCVGIEDLFAAMQFRNHTRAIELLREYLMNVTGRILP